MKKVFYLALALVLLAPAALAGEVYGPQLPIDTGDVSWLAQYIDFVAVGICLVVGLLWKHCLPLGNKYIPLVVVLVGLIVSVWTSWGSISPATILGGMFSGLVSVGFHQVFKQLFVE